MAFSLFWCRDLQGYQDSLSLFTQLSLYYLQIIAQRLKDSIPGLMTLCIVKTLEAVKIKHNNTKRPVVPLGPLDLKREGLFQIRRLNKPVSGSRIDC